jgi:hypothetical protein
MGQPHGRKSARYAIHNLCGTSMGTWMALPSSMAQMGSRIGSTTSSLNIRLIVFWRRSPLSLKKQHSQNKTPNLENPCSTYVLLIFDLF